VENLTLQIEALIIASEQSITKEEIREVIAKTASVSVTEDMIDEALRTIMLKYEQPDAVMTLKYLNNGYQLLTKQVYYPAIQQLQAHRAKKKLSQSALETLAIIAYRQPITKLEVEQIRGVNCDYSIQKLLDRELIQIAGKADTAGRPLLYGTSTLFMDYFGINHTSDLPKLKDILPESNAIGDADA
jgi:segregation and condensation protein B